MLLICIKNNKKTIPDIHFVKCMSGGDTILSKLPDEYDVILIVGDYSIRVINKEMEKGKYDIIKFDDNNEYLRVKVYSDDRFRIVLNLEEDAVFSNDDDADETVIDLSTIKDETDQVRIVRFKRMVTDYGIIVRRKEYISIS